jgi:peptidoglycan/xylan/chitin deacetylase (PgdA/CDA1 family)
MPKIDPKYPDLPASKWYDYGYKEGLPRLLEVFDRRKIKVTSHMVGAAVDLHPALAKEIVQRGHEASGHGQTWTAQFSMTPEEERASYQQSIESIQRATGRGQSASTLSGCAVLPIPWKFFSRSASSITLTM